MPYVVDFAAKPSLPAMFFDAASNRGDHPFMWAKRDNAWQAISYRQATDKVRALAKALIARGIEPGDRVALVSENRPEFALIHFAVMSAGAVTVPTYTTNTVADHKHIFSDSGAKLVFVSTRALASRVIPAAQDCPDITAIIGIEESFDASPLASSNLDAEIETGRALEDESLEARLAQIDVNALAILIYTSGTGGVPKGVMLSHDAIMLNCEGAYDVLKDSFDLADETFLSFLPLSHSYEHMAGLCWPISMGAQIYYAEGAEKLVANMAEVRPTVMTAVPRLFEAMRARVLKGIESAPKTRQRLFWMAVNIGRKRILEPENLTLMERLLDPLLDRLVRAKVRGRFGGRLKALVSGGAALTPDVGIFFQALGLTLLQGYGQTESAPLISVNRPEMLKMDTVGPACTGVEIKIAHDGEILARGRNIMMGYWNMPEATSQTVVDGWLHTGDIGKVDDQGRLMITDRKKDIIVLSGGDNVSPARVEGILTLEPEIAQAMVIGDKRPNLGALLVPSEDFIEDWAKSNSKPAELPALADDLDFIKAMKAAVDRANKSLSNIEKVRRICIATEAFSTENGQMTASLKTRRHIVKDLYADKLEALYTS